MLSKGERCSPYITVLAAVTGESRGLEDALGRQCRQRVLCHSAAHQDDENDGCSQQITDAVHSLSLLRYAFFGFVDEKQLA